MTYRILLLFTFLCYLSGIRAQTLNLNRVHINAGDIEDYTLTTFEFPFTNLSNKEVEVSLIPKSFFTNPQWATKKIGPNASDVIKLDFYPNKPGKFDEKIKLKVDDKTVTTLSYSGEIVSLSKQYKQSQNGHQLSSEKEIVFMVVDADNYEFLPNAKIVIFNIDNNKSYIGTTDYKGVLKDKLPNGKYYVEGQVDGYNKEIVGTEVEPRRNAALILLRKTAEKDKGVEKLDPIKSEANPEIAQNSPITKAPIVLPDLEPVKTVETPKVEEKTIEKEDVKVKPIYSADRKTFNIILLMDNSMSMSHNDRIDVLKNSLRFLINNYRPDDQLSIITFNDSVKTILPTTRVSDKKAVINIIDSIKTSGKTDGIQGINQAIEALKQNTVDTAVNMIVLSTDGRITSKSYEQKIILQKIQQLRDEGYYFSTISFGTSEFDDRIMKQMAEVGGGAFINLKKSQGANADNLLLDEIYSHIFNQ